MQVNLSDLIYPPPFTTPIAACGTPAPAEHGFLLNCSCIYTGRTLKNNLEAFSFILFILRNGIYYLQKRPWRVITSAESSQPPHQPHSSHPHDQRSLLLGTIELSSTWRMARGRP